MTGAGVTRPSSIAPMAAAPRPREVSTSSGDSAGDQPEVTQPVAERLALRLGQRGRGLGDLGGGGLRLFGQPLGRAREPYHAAQDGQRPLGEPGGGRADRGGPQLELIDRAGVHGVLAHQPAHAHLEAGGEGAEHLEGRVGLLARAQLADVGARDRDAGLGEGRGKLRPRKTALAQSEIETLGEVRHSYLPAATSLQRKGSLARRPLSRGKRNSAAGGQRIRKLSVDTTREHAHYRTDRGN